MAQKMETVVRMRRRPGFLRNFELGATQFVKADFASGRPGLREALFDGIPVLIKHWLRKPSVDDSDLQEIWRHELRQLQRLAGYPGAGDRIANLLSTSQDKDGFYLVLDLGQRRPLQVILDSLPPGSWLKNPRNPASRLRIWQNVRRLVEAMETLHSQGLLHRNIDNWAVLTSGEGEPDFQLTGFEWSMRLTGQEHSAGKFTRKKDPADTFDSFRSDWGRLGLLAANLLDANVERLNDISIPAFQVRDYLDAYEVRLLRQMLGKEPLDPMDGSAICRAIDEIARRLEAGIARKEAQYGLVVRLGDGSRLSEAIRKASSQEIDIADIASQLMFIEGDLGTEPLLIPVGHLGESEPIGFQLRGHALTYKVSPFRPIGQQPNWDIAYCDSSAAHPVASKQAGHVPIVLPRSTLQVISSKEASNPHSRRRFTSWEGLRQAFATIEDGSSPERQLLRALALSQLVELAFAVSDIVPVRVLSTGSQHTDDEPGVLLTLEVRSDQDRESLSKALSEPAIVDRFKRMLNAELGGHSDSAAPESQGIWTLTDTPTFGERSPVDVELRFEGMQDDDGRSTFSFSAREVTTSTTELYLVPSASAGLIAQFKRRIRALNSLGEHQELLKMLVDQRLRLLDSQDPADFSDEHFASLDEAKQEALCEMTSVLPLYLVQGPPGVGKTHLVKELVRRRFIEEPTTRLLMTAQSHSAVDHLMHEVVSAVTSADGTEPPLIIRCKNRKASEQPEDFDLSVRSSELIARVVSSPLAAKASPHLAQRLEVLGQYVQKEGSGKSVGTKEQRAKAAFEGVVLRAANMVFSTTNSPDLERLIEERGQFDWTIVEEAGKATGGELVSPLLLSHRRLMIGDHKQLPPHRSDEMKAVLKSPGSIKEILAVAPNLISRSLRGDAMEDLLEYWQGSDEALAAVGAIAVDALLMFETMIEAEFGRQGRSKFGRRIARSLTVQHRMHPLIADLISKTFYNGSLCTDQKRKARFETEPSPVRSKAGSWLPNKAITIVNVPDLQGEVGQLEGDSLPPWTNNREIRAVEWVLSQLQADNGASPSLAVLSPYARQVERLRRSISIADPRLTNLDGFSTANGAPTFCGTVDSFQGSEADVVVVSLVRNNHYTKPTQALGFLTDSRRMNVLLSRAKHRMVLVGSFDFLRSITEQMTGRNAERFGFLRDLVVALDEGVSRNEVGLVQYRDVEVVA
ncbi:AAA domain-containing protein [Stenotrophomonas geniculata]|uniref:AAA domain-containing protein n=1 Tax=Stenotrophomonas geniculata TaxID=86188 RepID=UPI00287FC06D|nr:AAA domain-containing protein [Stenotrophomonas geniculata]WNF12237.1 AAA domain-containing protein [Stenotrophomonas geniculata]